MTDAVDSVAVEARRLAEAHGVCALRDDVSRMASALTSLSGDDVVLDEVEQLLVNLCRAGVLSTTKMLDLQVRYLKERGPSMC